MTGEPRLPPLLVIAGPTATGKTDLAIRLAEAVNVEGAFAEIVSADSRQVYRGLDIGTAKATPAERARVHHHGLDIVDPDEPFSVADFAAHARGALAAIAARAAEAGRPALGILVGGTGLYLRAVARGLDTDALPSDRDARARIEEEVRIRGLDVTVERLRTLAPRLAAGVDLRNPRRVARALEIAELRGDAPLPPPRGFPAPVAWIGLDVPIPTHDAWIAARARGQLEGGLLDEARRLRERFDAGLPAFSAIGYREAWAVIDGTMALEDAIALDARRNRAFARRQRTWFRSEPGIAWLDAFSIDPSPVALEIARGLVRQGPQQATIASEVERP